MPEALAPRIAVVIPSYRVRKHVLDVIARIGTPVDAIYVVDDCCPEHSGQLVQSECRDDRVRVLFHEHNQGVGGAVMTGYRAAIADGADIIVKIDGDGQMDRPSCLCSLRRCKQAMPTTPRATVSSISTISPACRACACGATPSSPS